MIRPRSTTLAVLMTLAGCPSDAPVDDDGDGTTGSSTGGVGTTPSTAGSSSSEGSDSTGPDSADSGSSESTADSGSTDSGSTGSGSTGSGSTGSGSSSEGSTDSGSSGSGSSGSGSSGSGSSGSGSSGSNSSDSGSSSEGSTTGDDEIGFQQCDSPDDCLPGEGCLNDDVDNPTVAVCFLEGCVTDDDCPAVPEGGDSDAFCVDVTGDGVDDCVIVCSSTVCPTGMECFLNSICAWPLD